MKMNFIKTLTLFLLVLGGVFFSTGLRAQLFSGTANGVYDMEVTSGTSLTINAIGADGGFRSFTNNPGGTGGTVEATFAVNPGDFIRVIIGQSGRSATNDGSGGGGTAVINCGSSLLNCDNNLGTLLITAGAGGGAGINSNGGGATNVQGPGTNGNGQGNESASQAGCNIYSGVGNHPGPGFGYGGPGFGGFGGGGAGYTGGNGNPNRSGADGGSNYVNPSGTNVTNESGTDGGSTLSDGQITISGSAVLDILSAVNCVETVVYDSDQDGVSDGNDNCPYVANPGQEDTNGNGVGDVCEIVSDDDGDGVPNGDDLCANTPTGEGVNADGCSCSQVTVDDGDPCTLDECVDGVVTHTFQDTDGDGVCDANDVCPGGDDNMDADADGTPDFCDACPNDPNNDIDGDGICGNMDNCSNTSNPNQEDADGDGIGDACDPCPNDETNSCGQTYYEDQDDDGYSTFATVFTSLPPNGYKLLEELLSTYLSDCDDADAYEYPGQIWYKDADGDNHSNGTLTTSCLRPAGFKVLAELTSTNDCDDTDANEYPGQTWYKDADGDNYTDGSMTVSCLRPTGYKLMAELTGADDCDDSSAATYPGAPEICDNQDNDCDGDIDEGVGGATYVGNVTFSSQAQIDAWSACYSTIQGNLTISGGGINNLGPLSNLTTVTGMVIIFTNYALTSLNGLDNLATVGGPLYIYYNFSLANCCAIDDLLENGGVAGTTIILGNSAASHCNSAAQIMAACPITPLVSNPDNGFASGEMFAEKTTARSVGIFPNPAKGHVNIELNGYEGTVELMVTDQLGRTVWSQQLDDAHQVQLDLSNGDFQNGIYLISVISNGERTTQRLVVTK